MPAPTGTLPYLGTSVASLLVPNDISIEGLIDESAIISGNNPPSASALDALYNGIVAKVLAHVNARGQICDRSMRELARQRKLRLEAERDAEERKRLLDEERRKRQARNSTPLQRDHDATMQEDDTRPPTVGVHGLAPQDGSERLSSAAAYAHSTAMHFSDPSAAATDPDRVMHHQPPPAAPVAQYQSFGDDPTVFNDPTIYGIREISPSMSEQEKLDILSVTTYPHDDLSDLTPGTPADHDYSNAKPANQVTFSTFISYVEPYVRQLTEEDVAFLKERGDRVQPFLIPSRGSMHYRQVWAKEDGGLVPRDPHDGRLPPNEARGSIEDMNDDVAATEELSSGPLLSRLLAAFRHEPQISTTTNGTTQDNSVDVTMIDADATRELDNAEAGIDLSGANNPPKPASHFPDISTSATRLTSTHRTYASLEQRMLGELRYHGLLTPEASPEYDGQFDDEVAERLRLLQSELRQVSTENAARKARVLELTEERMAMQEYATIADDLDNQINAAYTKRNRTMNRPKKGVGKARPGNQSAGPGLGVGRSTVSEGVRMLMERRLQWKNLIGPVVDFGQKGIPKTTVFDPQTMDRLTKLEGEAAAGIDDA